MKSCFLLMFLWFGLALLPAQQLAPPQILAVNLFALPMDLRIGDWQVQSLGARSVTPMSSLGPGAVNVEFRRTGQLRWSFRKNADGIAEEFRPEPGQVYLVVCLANGSAEFVNVGATSTTDPKVLFVNASRGPAVTFGLGSSVHADGLDPGWSNFLDATPGPQVLQWSWTVMPPGTDQYQAASAQPGQPALTNLAVGHWYVAIAASFQGTVYDVTPR